MGILYVVELQLIRIIVADEIQDGHHLRVVAGVDAAVEDLDVDDKVGLIDDRHIEGVAELIPHADHRGAGAPADDHTLCVFLDALLVHADIDVIDVLGVLLICATDEGLDNLAQLLAHVILGIGVAIDEVPLLDGTAELLQGRGQRQQHTAVGREEVVAGGVEVEFGGTDAGEHDGLVEADAGGRVGVGDVLERAVRIIVEEMAAHNGHRHRLSIDDGALAGYLAQLGTHLYDLVEVAGGFLLQGIEAHKVAVLTAAQHNLIGGGRYEGELIVGGEAFGLCAGGLRPIVDERVVGVEGEHHAEAGDNAVFRLHDFRGGGLHLVALGVVDEHLTGHLHDAVGREACRVGNAAQRHVAGVEIHGPAVLLRGEERHVVIDGLLLALCRRGIEDIVGLGGARQKDDGKEDPPPGPSHEGGELLTGSIKYGS